MEKHLRGSLARSDREARVEEKEKKKRLKTERYSTCPVLKVDFFCCSFSQGRKKALSISANALKYHFRCSLHYLCFRISRKESTRNLSQRNLAPKLSFQPQLSGLSVNSGQPNFQNQRSSGAYANSKLPAEKEDKHINQASESMVVYRTLPDRERKYTEIQDVKHTSKDPLAGSTSRFYLNDNQGPVNTFSSMNGTNGFPLSHRHPLTTMNGFPPIRQQSMQQQLCRHYAKGRCYYGDNCKFSHGKIEEYVQRRDERLPLHHTSWHNTRI